MMYHGQFQIPAGYGASDQSQPEKSSSGVKFTGSDIANITSSGVNLITGLADVFKPSKPGSVQVFKPWSPAATQIVPQTRPPVGSGGSSSSMGAGAYVLGAGLLVALGVGAFVFFSKKKAKAKAS